MSDAPADGPLEPLEWLTWPTVCVRSAEQSVVIIDIAPIDEDEITRRAPPDTDHDVRILGTCAVGTGGTSRSDASRGAFAGSVGAFAAWTPAALQPADDPIAFVRGQV